MELRTNIQVVVGKNIRGERESKELRQSDLARMSSIAESGIQEIEAGRRNPRIVTLQLISEALRVPLSSLVIEHADRDYFSA